KKRLIDPSVAHQIFGRAGRPQFDTEGHVFALAHEDDVRILRAKRKLEQIPEDTRDPLLIKKRKQMKKKLPKRRTTVQYWGEAQLTRLIEAPPTSLRSQGQIPWRLLAFLLSHSSEVTLVRDVISRRLMEPQQVEKAQRLLVGMLLTLESAGCVTLSPPPSAQTRAAMRPESAIASSRAPGDSALLARIRELAEQGAFTEEAAAPQPVEDSAEAFGLGVADNDQLLQTVANSGLTEHQESEAQSTADRHAVESTGKPHSSESHQEEPARESSQPARLTTSLKLLLEAQGVDVGGAARKGEPGQSRLVIRGETADNDDYSPSQAFPTERLADLLTFKSINPLYGLFLLEVLPHVTPAERLMALESVLEFPGSLVKSLRIPKADMLPPGAFTTGFLDPELLQRGLASTAELGDVGADWYDLPPEERVWPLTFPEKLQRLFQHEAPGVDDVPLLPVWAAGSLLEFGGDFNKLVTSKSIARQEGIVFRHVLRVVLLCEEFSQHLPADSAWCGELMETADLLTEACRTVDARSTDQMIESARSPDIMTAGEPQTAETKD
ncbi:MAG: hypothetical protein VB858_06570, partial [Planctomycetaceae bacterium]